MIDLTANADENCAIPRAAEHGDQCIDTLSVAVFPSRTKLLFFVVLLPTAVSISNQLLLKYASSYHLQSWLYPWMALSTAVLGWCVGRYLSPPWLQWLVLAWCLALLDLLTIAACLSGPVEHHFAYVLVSAQISLITLWAILSPVGWQWRLSGILIGASALIFFVGIVAPSRRWREENWLLLMVLTALIVLLLCGLLRLSGFKLERLHARSTSRSANPAVRATQFGMKHMLAWATALAPMLLLFRGIDFLLLKRLGGQGTFPLALLALTIATVNLISIWSTLGGGSWVVRLSALILVPFILGIGTKELLDYFQSVFQYSPRPGVISYTNAWYNSLVYGISDRRDTWTRWLWLDATLLAALLLFLRASGYRLAKSSAAPAVDSSS